MTFVRMSRLLCLTCLAALAASQAHAGVLRCSSHFTGFHDRALLRTAMQEAMPPGVSAWGIPDICRNPGSAYAWMSSWARRTPDGVTHWWDFNCHRQRGPWECDSPVQRNLIWVYADVGGILRRLEVRFDDDTGLDRARQLAVHAAQIVQDPASAPLAACGSGSREEERAQWEKARRAQILQPRDVAVGLSVETAADGGVDVIWEPAADFGLRFTDGTATSPPVCWAQWVVVG